MSLMDRSTAAALGVGATLRAAADELGVGVTLHEVEADEL